MPVNAMVEAVDAMLLSTNSPVGDVGVSKAPSYAVTNESAPSVVEVSSEDLAECLGGLGSKSLNGIWSWRNGSGGRSLSSS